MNTLITPKAFNQKQLEAIKIDTEHILRNVSLHPGDKKSREEVLDLISHHLEEQPEENKEHTFPSTGEGFFANVHYRDTKNGVINISIAKDSAKHLDDKFCEYFFAMCRELFPAKSEKTLEHKPAIEGLATKHVEVDTNGNSDFLDKNENWTQDEKGTHYKDAGYRIHLHKGTLSNDMVPAMTILGDWRKGVEFIAKNELGYIKLADGEMVVEKTEKETNPAFNSDLIQNRLNEINGMNWAKENGYVKLSEDEQVVKKEDNTALDIISAVRQLREANDYLDSVGCAEGKTIFDRIKNNEDHWIKLVNEEARRVGEPKLAPNQSIITWNKTSEGIPTDHKVFLTEKGELYYSNGTWFERSWLGEAETHIVDAPEYWAEIPPASQNTGVDYSKCNFEMYFESKPDDFCKIDGWYPVDYSAIKKQENIEKYIQNKILRIIPAPQKQKIKGWVNVLRFKKDGLIRTETDVVIYETKETAESISYHNPTKKIIATVPIEFNL